MKSVISWQLTGMSGIQQIGAGKAAVAITSSFLTHLQENCPNRQLLCKNLSVKRADLLGSIIFLHFH